MIRLLLADDHKIVRNGIKALMVKAEDIEVVEECSSGREVVQALENGADLDVIAMDLSMPDMDGIEATERIMELDPDAKVIGLSMHNEEIFISKILNAGARGYILKNANEEDLIQGVRTIYSGSSYFGEGVTEIMMSKYMKGKGSSREGSPYLIKAEDLTEREKEVLCLIAEERTNAEIAEKLFISKRTVDSHRKHLLEKTGAKNTAGLVRFAMDHNIL
ncbi:MAG: response regulator [Flavobacteriales bacterium]